MDSESPAAERQRWYRQRLKRGLLVVVAETRNAPSFLPVRVGTGDRAVSSKRLYTAMTPAE